MMLKAAKVTEIFGCELHQRYLFRRKAGGVPFVKEVVRDSNEEIV